MTLSDFSTLTPPRPLPRALRRRVWFEPKVRFWFIAALFLLIVGLAFTVSGLLEWHREVALVRDGTLVQATIIESGGGINHHLIAEDSPWDVKFELNGKQYAETGFPPATDKPHYNNEVIPLRVDAADPSHWTNRTQPPSIDRELVGIMLVLPLVLICVLAALVRAMRLRSACISGPVHLTSILKIGQSALAPGSYAVRCTPADGSSRAIYTVFLPRRLSPQPGDELTVVTPSPRSTLAFPLSP